MSDEERFWAKVDKSGSCWLWTAAIMPSGYGQIGMNGRLVAAHRWAYEDTVGPIPEGHQLDHLCRVRHCVNPDHLEPVTQRTNILRGIGATAINARKTHCHQGHEFTPENTYLQGGTRRVCRQSKRERDRKYREEHRNAR